MEKTYYAIRIVKASSAKEAIQKVEDGKIDESHFLCDKVITEEELIKQLLKLNSK